MDIVIDSIRDIPQYFDFASLRTMPLPASVLMCPSDYFDVVDVKNAFMEGQYGKVDRALAKRQWSVLANTLRDLGLKCFSIPPAPGLEDMVFTANQTFCGVDIHGQSIAILSQMRHPSRQKEVPLFDSFFTQLGLRTEKLPDPKWQFEGMGDALWHPRKAMIWGGVGPRTGIEVYPWLSKRFFAPVVRLKLSHPYFYHLDTCFCPLSESSVLYCPEAFDEDGVALIKYFFKEAIEVDVATAKTEMVCNALSIDGKHLVVQKGAWSERTELKQKMEIVPVDTGEFMKSGGSVFCMKMMFWDPVKVEQK